MINIRKRDLLYIALVLLALWVIYMGRSIITPFLLAAVFAYVLNPVVTFLSHKTKLPRVAAVTLIYFAMIVGVGFLIVTVWSRFAEESLQLTREANTFFHQAQMQIDTLPAWLQPIASDALETAHNSTLLSPKRLAQALPGAVNHLVGVLIFLVAAFYFLKDGHTFITGFFNLFPPDLKFEIEVVARKVNKVLGDYLRAQLLLVVIMSALTFLVLTIIGVRYSVSLALFTGVAETVPYVGPVVAAVLAMVVAYTDGASRLGVDPLVESTIVALSYTVLRQVEDYLIIPQVLGRVTKLHPLIVLFAALFGGHLFGIMGFIAAVPVVASLRVILEHTLDLFNKKTLQD